MSLILRLLLTALILAGLVPLYYIANFSSTLPLRVDRDPERGYLIAKNADLPLPDGVQEGDVVDLSRMRLADRVAALQIANSPRNLVVHIALRRGDQTRDITVTTVPDTTPGDFVKAAPYYLTLLSLVALALITLWRGRDRAAWGLLLFGSLILIQNMATDIPVDPLVGFALAMFGTALLTVAISGLYITADALAGDGLRPATRQRIRWVVLLCCVIATAGTLARRWLILVEGHLIGAGWTSVTSLPLLLTVALSVIVLALGFRHSDAAQKLRIRWVLFSTTVLLLMVCSQVLFPQRTLGVSLVYGVLNALTVSGYLYAVLRHRLVDVSFIIDRTLVYGVTTALVVAVFALLEKIVENFALGKDASVSLQAGVTLLIALVLNRVHHRVEHAVDRYLFRRQHQAIAELRQFARECAFVEHYPRLLQLSVERVQTAIGGSGVAIYERRADGYDCAIRCGSIAVPEQIDSDDAAFVAMRTTRQHIETPHKSSALAFDGYAFPIMQRERIIGALICGARLGEKLAPDELEALDVLAREIGRAIYDLRMREYERFLASLAADQISNPGEQARRLAQSGYAIIAASRGLDDHAIDGRALGGSERAIVGSESFAD